MLINNFTLQEDTSQKTVLKGRHRFGKQEGSVETDIENFDTEM
jgi:hypothetical protein